MNTTTEQTNSTTVPTNTTTVPTTTTTVPTWEQMNAHILEQIEKDGYKHYKGCAECFPDVISAFHIIQHHNNKNRDKSKVIRIVSPTIKGSGMSLTVFDFWTEAPIRTLQNLWNDKGCDLQRIIQTIKPIDEYTDEIDYTMPPDWEATNARILRRAEKYGFEHFKGRAECFADVITAFHIIAQHNIKHPHITENIQIISPTIKSSAMMETDFDFWADVPIRALQKLWNDKAHDLHRLIQTIKPIDEYTGEIDNTMWDELE